MCTSSDGREAPRAAAGRRTFLRAAAVAGAATAFGPAAFAAAEPATASADRADSAWRPDPESARFTLAVMPDTHYLFDGPGIQPAPVEASLRYLLKEGRADNVVFLSHLGDLTQNGTEAECAAIGKAFGVLDRRGAGYSVLAGDHDVPSRTDDRRGDTLYLRTFGHPERPLLARGPHGAEEQV